MVKKNRTRSSVYEKPTFKPLSLHAAKCKQPERTLQGLMGMTNKTPTFKYFAETAEKWACHFLDPTQPKEGQDPRQWQKFEAKVAKYAPCYLQYEDHWPLECFVKIWIRLVYHKERYKLRMKSQSPASVRTRMRTSPTTIASRVPSESPSAAPNRSPSPPPAPPARARPIQAKAPEINLRLAVRARRQSLSTRSAAVFRIKREDGLPRIPPILPDQCIRATSRSVAAVSAASEQPEAAPTQGSSVSQCHAAAIPINPAAANPTSSSASAAAAAVPREKRRMYGLQAVVAFLSSFQTPLTHLLPVLGHIGVHNYSTLLGLACMPNRRLWMDRVLGPGAIGGVEWRNLQDGLDVLELTEG
ncbi:hypothetical protein GY45DRAFT_1430106 [Cubamyces sp. BRFM 1775]|nr:hypothetical protein GY45DRAFT_1430106 [Cubamyces sp. BRFM 1775]